MKSRVVVAIIGGIFLVLAALIPEFTKDGDATRGTKNQPDPQKEQPVVTAIDAEFFPSGWMGDGENGTEYIKFAREPVEVLGKTRVAIKIQYTPGPKGWAGVYWLYPDGNWGSERGKDLTGVKRITFWAKGSDGTEIVEFKSGGVKGVFPDSYECSLGKKLLTKEWQEYSFDLANYDLSNVSGAFAWICAGSDAAGKPVTFYIAEIGIEK